MTYSADIPNNSASGMDGASPGSREFINPAADSKGHSEVLGFRVPPGQAVQIQAIISSRWFPYRTESDLLRHALVRHLKWLEGQAPIKSMSAQFEVISLLYSEQLYQAEFEKVFRELDVFVGKYLVANQVDRARSLVAQVSGLIDDMPDGAWRDQFRAEVSRFGYLLTPSI